MNFNIVFFILFTFASFISESSAQSDYLDSQCQKKLIEVVKKEAAFSSNTKADYVASIVPLDFFFSTIKEYFDRWGNSAIEGNEIYTTFKSMFDVYANANNLNKYPKRIVKIEVQWVNQDSEDSFFKEMYFAVVSWRTPVCSITKKSTFILWD